MNRWVHQTESSMTGNCPCILLPNGVQLMLKSIYVITDIIGHGLYRLWNFMITNSGALVQSTKCKANGCMRLIRNPQASICKYWPRLILHSIKQYKYYCSRVRALRYIWNGFVQCLPFCTNLSLRGGRGSGLSLHMQTLLDYWLAKAPCRP